MAWADFSKIPIGTDWSLKCSYHPHLITSYFNVRGSIFPINFQQKVFSRLHYTRGENKIVTFCPQRILSGSVWSSESAILFFMACQQNKGWITRRNFSRIRTFFVANFFLNSWNDYSFSQLYKITRIISDRVVPPITYFLLNDYCAFFQW